KRGSRSSRNLTFPSTQFRILCISGGADHASLELEHGMKSVAITLEPSMLNSVTRMLVFFRYVWEARPFPTGARRHLPPVLLPSIAAKRLGESNLGRQHQSIDPS